MISQMWSLNVVIAVPTTWTSSRYQDWLNVQLIRVKKYRINTGTKEDSETAYHEQDQLEFNSKGNAVIEFKEILQVVSDLFASGYARGKMFEVATRYLRKLL